MAKRQDQIKIAKKNINIPEQTFRDIDQAVLEYFTKTIAVFVIENNIKIDVPILMSGGERWAQLKNNRNLTDKDFQAVFPIGKLTRGAIEPVVERYIYPANGNRITVHRELAPENAWKRTSEGISPRKPISVSYDIEPPTFVNVNYSLNFYTRYKRSINLIIEQILLNHVKFDLIVNEAYYLRGELGSFENESNSDDFSDELKLEAASTSIVVSGYIYSKIKNNVLNFRKTYSPGRISFTEKMG